MNIKISFDTLLRGIETELTKAGEKVSGSEFRGHNEILNRYCVPVIICVPGIISVWTDLLFLRAREQLYNELAHKED